jgi:hypothetical protein
MATHLRHLSGSDPHVLCRLLREAAETRIHIVGHLSDDIFINDLKGRIVYSVDYDVITMYFDLFKENIPDIGRIYSDDPHDLVAAMSRTLAEFIFFNGLITSAPLLVLPNVDAEFDEQINWILDQFARSASKREPHLKRFERDLRTTILNLESIDANRIGEEDKKRLNRRLGVIFRMLLGNGSPAWYLSRLRRLIDHQSVMTLRAFATQVCPEDIEEDVYGLLHTVAAPPNMAQDVLLQEIESRWVKLLREHRPSKAEAATQKDATALAHVEFANMLADAQEREGAIRQPIRVLHLTGSDAIFAAAERYNPKFANPTEESFAALYLRHPKGFLVERNLFIPDESELTQGGIRDRRSVFRQLLDMVLASNVEIPGFRSADLDLTGDANISAHRRLSHVREVRSRLIAAKRLKADDPSIQAILQVERHQITAGQRKMNLADEMNSRWKELTKGIVSEYARMQLDVASDSSRRRASLIDEISASADRLQADDERHYTDRLEQITRSIIKESWENYFKILTTPGYLLTAASDDAAEFKTRGTATLIFVGKPDSNKVIESAMQQAVVADRLRGRRFDYFPQAIEDIKQADQSDYGFYILLAQLFAIEQRWRRVVDLADRAIDVAVVAQRDDRSAPMGREAYFLRAIATRMTARNRESLAEALIFTDKAKLALSDDIDFANVSKSVTNVRFDAEVVAIEVSAVLFERFSTEIIPSADLWIESARGTLNKAVTLYEAIAADLNEARLKGEQRDLTQEQLRDREKACRFAGRRVLINIFILAWHLCERGVSRSEVRTAIPDFDAKAQELLEDSHGQPRALPIFLNYGVYLGINAMFALPIDISERLRLASKITVHFDQSKLPRHVIMPYDVARYNLIRNVSLDIINGRRRIA